LEVKLWPTLTLLHYYRGGIILDGSSFKDSNDSNSGILAKDRLSMWLAQCANIERQLGASDEQNLFHQLGYLREMPCKVAAITDIYLVSLSSEGTDSLATLPIGTRQKQQMA
jgi:hypothetical protein